MRKQRSFFIIIVLLLTSLSAHAQYGNDTYTLNITGVSSITLLGPEYQNTNPYDKDTNPFNYENDMGTYYPDADGVIRIELKRGYYEYITDNSGMNGSFYINTRNIYFDIYDLPTLYGVDSRKKYIEAYRCLTHKEKKRARELFQVAADAGNVKAMHAYARMCYNGMGGGKNKNHAYHYMVEAQKHGDPLASYLLENFKDNRAWKWYL